jgi:hypothetical protein
MSVNYSIQDIHIENVHIGIHNTEDGTSISRGRIVGTSGHGILSSGNRTSISDTFINPRSGNGITITGGSSISISRVTVVGGHTGIQIGGTAASETTPADKLDAIIDRFLAELSQIKGALAVEIYDEVAEFKYDKKRSITAETYNRIIGFMSNHTTVLTFAYQFFPVLFGQAPNK